MKKPIYLTLAVLLALAVFGCKTPEKEPEKKDPPKTLDPRLVGGRWYFPKNFSSPYNDSLTPRTSSGYYQFTSDSKLIYSKETAYYQRVAMGLSGGSVYSKNGIVYWKETDDKILQYEFHNTFPYTNSPGFYLLGIERFTLNVLATYGDFITYRIFIGDNLFEDDSYASPLWWFLVRFSEGGTAYQDYDE
jgi:hypothetical protein